MTLIHIPQLLWKEHGFTKLLPYCLECSNCQICPVTQFSSAYTVTSSYVYGMISSETPLDEIDVWKCVVCHSCENVCPFDISAGHLIEGFKIQAFKAGFAPTAVVELAKSIATTGRGFQVSARTNREREALGLPLLSVEDGDDYRQLSEITGLDKILAEYKAKEDSS